MDQSLIRAIHQEMIRGNILLQETAVAQEIVHTDLLSMMLLIATH